MILNSYSSYITASFDYFCTKRKIIPLYIPPYLSYLFQPLDISCFALLKHYYSQKVGEIIQNSIYTINKREFLSIYTKIYGRVFSKANIISGFIATRLIPLKPDRVLIKLSIKIKTLTPPSFSSSNKTCYLGRTLANLY